MNNSVVIARVGVRGLNGNEKKNTIKKKNNLWARIMYEYNGRVPEGQGPKIQDIVPELMLTTKALYIFWFPFIFFV